MFCTSYIVVFIEFLNCKCCIQLEFQNVDVCTDLESLQHFIVFN